VRFEGSSQATLSGALSVIVHLRVFTGRRDLGAFEARRNLFLQSPTATSDIALRSSPRDDLYVTLTGGTQNRRAALRLLVNPLVAWIWTGGLVLTLGAAVAVAPERRRVPVTAPMPHGAWSPSGLRRDEDIFVVDVEFGGIAYRRCGWC
jgi:cytochrome c biogenesis factor